MDLDVFSSSIRSGTFPAKMTRFARSPMLPRIINLGNLLLLLGSQKKIIESPNVFYRWDRKAVKGPQKGESSSSSRDKNLARLGGLHTEYHAYDLVGTGGSGRNSDNAERVYA